MEECYICGQETENFIQHLQWHGVHVAEKKTILNAHQVVCDLLGHWMHGSALVTHEAKFIVEQCVKLLEKRSNEYDKLCMQFEESGCLNGNSLCQLSNTVFNDKANWGRMVAVFALLKIMNKIPTTVLIQWLTHVYCSSERCARDFYVREWLKRHEKFMANNEQT